ncbi:Sulfated surface glycoprotein, partial [Tetrabaena socialis]
YLNNYAGEQNWVCFKVLVNQTNTLCTGPVADQPPCCKTDLYKLEFNVSPDPACQRASTRVLLFKGLNTVVQGVTIKEETRTIAVDELDLNPAAAILRIAKGLQMPQSVLSTFNGGLPVCVNFRPQVQCTSLQKFFLSPDTVQYAIFNSDKDCCPSGIVGPPGGDSPKAGPPPPEKNFKPKSPPPSPPPPPPPPEDSHEFLTAALDVMERDGRRAAVKTL